jgi:hypothetical protein
MTPRFGRSAILRRILFVLLTALLGLTGWACAAGSAYAGGPTSVLLANTGRARVHALYTTDSTYHRLLAAVGDAEVGDSTEPSWVPEDVKDAVTLTWLVHDVTVWRVDSVVLTLDDGIWVGTVVGVTGEGNLNTGPSRGHRAEDDKGLTAVLSAAGLLGERAKPRGDSPTSTAPTSTTPASTAPPPTADGTSAAATVTAPGQPMLAIVATGLGGLVIGALGALLLLRPRTIRADRVTLTG